MKPHRVIAIDGPAASGKSSVARALARELGEIYINTGAMYRAAAWLSVREGLTDPEALVAALPRLRFFVENGELAIRLGEEDPAPQLGNPEVNAAVSPVAAIAPLRAYLVARQREFAAQGNLVMEGRDIGTAVFPGTPFKFYIDASPEVRARRRAAQGLSDDLATRDRIDSSRAASPLAIAPGAVVIDSSELTIEGVVAAILPHLRIEE